MRLPDLSSPERAEAVIEDVLLDGRVARLRHAFSPRGNLPMILAHAESTLLSIRSPDERAQLNRVIARWTGLMSATSSCPQEVDPLAALVSDAVPWDMRAGAERDAIPTSVELFPQEIADLIMEVAQDWHMTASSTARGQFDVVMPIGGLVRANVSRPAFAARLLEAGTVSAHMVIGLASQRATSRAEQEVAARLGAPVHSEQSALEFGMERAFGFGAGDWSSAAAPSLKQGPTRDRALIFAGAAPPNDLTGRRATTGEAFAWLLTTSVLPARARVLQITASHCWLANHVALLTQAPADVSVTTVGTPPMRSADLGSQRYLQEMKAFIDSLPRLRAWANARGSGRQKVTVVNNL